MGQVGYEETESREGEKSQRFEKMNQLSKKALTGIIKLDLALALLLFLPAWSARFWEAGVYLLLFSLSVVGITFYFLKRDPHLIERRLKAGPGAEKEKSQIMIQIAASVLWCALFFISGLDHRFHWSSVPGPLVLAADGFVLAGFLIVFLVFKENSYASAVIEVKADQQLISTGPYRLVRHPMYSGALLMVLATPFALGSIWALSAALFLSAVIVVRLFKEEQFLAEHLSGYVEYCRKVRRRLVPFVW